MERWLPWTSACLSVLLHALLLLVLLDARQPVLTPPQGASSGGRVRVDFIGEPAQVEQPAPVRQRPAPVQVPQATAPARERVEPLKPVPEALYIAPPDAPQPEPADRQEPPADSAARAPAASSPAPAQRRPETWTGRPPGLIEEDVVTGAGRSPGPVNRDGDFRDTSAGAPNMEVGGYQIVYELLGEARLREWMAQGMTELSIPLPGVRERMVCPAEVALRRGSGKCRLLDPDSPQMQAIGDARQVVAVMAVYRYGELIWRGPGPYR